MCVCVCVCVCVGGGGLGDTLCLHHHIIPWEFIHLWSIFHTLCCWQYSWNHCTDSLFAYLYSLIRILTGHILEAVSSHGQFWFGIYQSSQYCKGCGLEFTSPVNTVKAGVDNKDNKNSDQTVQMRWLIWVFVGNIWVQLFKTNDVIS